MTAAGPNPLEQLQQWLTKSQLVPPDALGRALEAARDAGREGPAEILTHLVESKLLTNYQARLIGDGRYRGFLINGKYKLLELIAVGGMGAVYLCEHASMRRLVAVKVLPRETGSAGGNRVERFLREARAAGSLDHPNLVRAFDLDRISQGGNHCLILEYVDGPNLSELSKKVGPLPVELAVNYACQAAEGLQHAHEIGWVHRDIKPQNILVGRTGVVKVLDMGLARLFGTGEATGLTALYDGQVLGTADYIAPEQVVSSEVDIRADIYSLGATLYFMLTGQPPFVGGTIQQKLLRRQVQDPEPMSRWRPDAPPELAAVVLRMMALQPGDRPQTPREVVEALAPWLGLRVSAPPAEAMPQYSPLVMDLIANNDSARVPAGPLPSVFSRTTVDIAAPVSRQSGSAASDATAIDLSAPTWRGRSIGDTRTSKPGASGRSGSGSGAGGRSTRSSVPTPSATASTVPPAKTAWTSPQPRATPSFFKQNLLTILIAGFLGIGLLIAAIASYEANRPGNAKPKAPPADKGEK